MTLEIIATSLEDAVEAWRGGAHRLEIVRDLARDGFTPPIELVRRIQEAVPLPLRVMVRESDGFLCTSDDERRTLAAQAAAFAALGVDGIVVGWTRLGRIDEQTLGYVLGAASAVRATFHRAFDSLPDPEATLRVLKHYPQVDRVLTSGGADPWTARCDTLARYRGWAGQQIVLLVGGGVDANALPVLARSGVTEAHVGRAARTGQTVAGRVTAEAVRRLVQLSIRSEHGAQLETD